MSIMSVYGSLIYMTSIPGGWIADRITGTRRYFTRCSLYYYRTYLFKLTVCVNRLIHINVLHYYWFGLMKPNISNIVGRLYPENDRRWRFIFYMSVNMGALLSPIILQHFVNVKTSMADS